VELIEAVATDQLSDLARWIPAAPTRILDVGCGHGALSLALARLGHRVTAIDIDPEAIAAAATRGVTAVQADIAEYEAAPFDVVAFSFSLHHVENPAAALAGARRLLRPGGTLIVDEFAWERADRAAAAWFYDMAAVLAAAGVLVGHSHTAQSGGPPGADALDPLAFWVQRHRDEHGQHTGAAMVEAVDAHFEISHETLTPYLHRYLAGRLNDTVAGRRALDTLRRIEQLRIAAGLLPAVGLRLLAQPR
jgi:SAM-dependent methyltransferase